MNVLTNALFRFKNRIPRTITLGNKYGPAMKITDPEEAVVYLNMCIRHCQKYGVAHKEAETIERTNIGYWAGYYDRVTAARVQHLFNVTHPVFGDVEHWPTAEEAFAMGKVIGVNASTPEEEHISSCEPIAVNTRKH